MLSLCALVLATAGPARAGTGMLVGVDDDRLALAAGRNRGGHDFASQAPALCRLSRLALAEQGERILVLPRDAPPFGHVLRRFTE